MGDIWSCKIGETDVPREEWDHPFKPNSGADLPMRDAVREAYKSITGEDADFIFSGWGSSLDIGERAATENRLPTREELLQKEREELLQREDQLLNELVLIQRELLFDE